MEQNGCLKEFIRYTSLNVLGMIGLSCYILADTYFVSNGMGAAGLAALNLAIPVYSLIHGSGLMLGIGGATRYSIFRGQGAFGNGSRVFTNTVYSAAFLSFLFVAAGAFLSDGIAARLGADGEVYAMTAAYLRIILLFAPAFMMNDVLICFVRNDGSPRLSMLAMLLGSMSNIALDYVLIFPLRMGIAGAALATGLAPIISMAVMSGYVGRTARFRLKMEKPSPRLIGAVCSLGAPSFIAEAASGVVMVVFNTILLGLRGNIGVAAYGVIANLSLVVLSVYTGIAQGMQPLSSRAYGRQDSEGVRQILRYAIRAMLAASLLIYLGIFAFAGPIAGLFNSERDAQLQGIATAGLKLYFLAAPFAGTNVLLAMHFTSTETTLPAQAISLARGLILIIPLAFAFSLLGGIPGVWLSFPATECIVALSGTILYRRLSAAQGVAANYKR